MSKNSRRRAIVLIAVQLLIIAHIVLWVLSKKYGWFGGYTLTPVEPSESMEFSKHGVVNAGLIFFALALLSTLILGRWFCGWGCHVVMLQDFCSWLMNKCGVRPKPFRSRLLIYVPLLLAIYMFILPAVHRWGLVPLDRTLTVSWGETHWAVQSIRTASSAIGFPLPYAHMPEWKITSQLMTQDFWKTFASYGVAIPFLFVCGFAVVYFLGSKGFCTYGCPYGGFFAPLDKIAPGRILVTDACEGCGHCTAVCTSNVRVHEEVREYGMVVDPGCMKCLDCVSVCPKEALYFGFAKPAVLKGPAKNAKPKKHFDFSWGEEVFFAAVFLLTFLAVRGLYGLVPMLMAAGMAGIITFLTWKFWRLVRDPNVTLHKWQLKFKGKIKLTGVMFGGMALLMMGLTIHSGAVNAALARAHSYDEKVTVPQHLVFSGDPEEPSADMKDWTQRGLYWYGLASSIQAGGIGLSSNQQAQLDIRRAWLHSVRLEFADAERILRQAVKRDGGSDVLCSGTMRVMFAQFRINEALDFAEPHLLAHEEMTQTMDLFRRLGSEHDQSERVFQICRQRMDKFPNHLNTLRTYSMLLYQMGRFEEGNEVTRRTLVIDAKNSSAHYYLALGLFELQKVDEALQAMTEAHRLAPHSVPITGAMADLLDANGRNSEAEVFRQKVLQLLAEQQERAARPPGE